MGTRRGSTKLTLLFVVSALLLGQCQQSHAGWTGLINGLGVGWASVNVRSSTQASNKVTTASNLQLPSAAMAPTAGYKTNAPLPSGSATNTFSRIKGLSGGIWQATANAAHGDGTDNPEIQSRVNITPSDCALLVFDSRIDQTQQQFETNGHNGTITVNATATGGTALWLRGFEFTGSMADVPPDDPDTVENESVEYLKVHGLLKFDTLILGPFQFGGSNCPLIVPFSLTSSNLESLVFVADGVTQSKPLTISCPSDVVVKCGDPVVYPPVTVTGCGNIIVTFNPAIPQSGFFPAGYFPVGVSPVTVTATDDGGNSTNCSFNVTVRDITAPLAPTLSNLTGQCSVQVPTPTAFDVCGGTTNIIFGTTPDPTNYTTQGTFTVHWSFDDGHSNTSIATQTVIVKDTTAPVPPVLSNLTFNLCSGGGFTPPTPIASDNCKGPINGTSSVAFPITNLGTTTITWSFNDGNGNTSTATQNVNLTGLTFTGFYSPVGGTGGTCQQPKTTANQGSIVPIKFDIKCGSTLITAGTPPQVKIQAYSNNCTAGAQIISANAVYQNDWHYNWDTSPYPKGTYLVTVILPDGTSQFFFVKIK